MSSLLAMSHSARNICWKCENRWRDGTSGCQCAISQGGETKTIVWRFDPVKSKSVLFACYVPGHFEAGMYHRHVMLKQALPN
jgi:hypothetical protein